MGVETATYIDDLDVTLPAATDSLGQADDHLRLIKSTVKTTFPNVAGEVGASHTELNVLDGAVVATDDLTKLGEVTATSAELNTLDGITATTDELNYMDGVTSAVQTQIDTKANSANGEHTGTTSVASLDFGDFKIQQSGTGSSARLDFVRGTTVIMSIDYNGNLRVRQDISAYDQTA